MGYAEAAGLPAVTGLYASIGALVTYFLVGPSRVLVFGPDSALVPLVAAAVVPLAAGDPQRAAALAGALAILAGALCLGAALARLGFVTDLLSGPIRIGYMNGIAVTILVGQLPKLLGFSVDAPDVLGGLAGTVAGIRAGEVVPLALLVGLLCLAVILGRQAARPKVPGRARRRDPGWRARRGVRARVDDQGRRRRAAGVPADRPSRGDHGRPRRPLPHGGRHRPHLVRRHERHLALVRVPARRARRPGPRAGRPRRRQPRGRVRRRLLVERLGDPHPGRGAGRVARPR